MRTLWLLLLAVPLRAQTSQAPAVGGAIAQGAKDLAAAKAVMAPVAVAPEPVRELMECLIKTGQTRIRRADAVHEVFKRDSPAPAVSRRFALGLAEAFQDPAAGRIGDEKSMYRDLMERHTYTGFEFKVVTAKAGKNGAGEYDLRFYFLTLDAKLYDVLAVTGPGAFDKDGVLVPDDAKLKSYKLAPTAAKPAWESLAPYLALLCSSVEA